MEDHTGNFRTLIEGLRQSHSDKVVFEHGNACRPKELAEFEEQ